MGADPVRPIAAFSNQTSSVRVAREVASPSLSQIALLIKNQPSSIEAGMIAMDSDLFIPSVGEIDLVAVQNGRLVMVSIFSDLTADHLGKAAGIKQWVSENANVLKRVYLGGKSNGPFSPRILFLCSEVDGRALLLMKMIADLPLEIYRYRCLESGGNRWLIIEKVGPDKKVEQPVKAPSISPIKFDVELTNEEIGEFFEASNEINEESAFSGPYFNS